MMRGIHVLLIWVRRAQVKSWFSMFWGKIRMPYTALHVGVKLFGQHDIVFMRLLATVFTRCIEA